uniref:Uncharacterized protein n=1 Tax=Opuntia streptacantha TaxID=393608 RepID=A0A7C8Z878_OPUST
MKGREVCQEVSEASHSHSYRFLYSKNHQHQVFSPAYWMEYQKEVNFLVVIRKYHLTRLNREETEDQSCPCHASAFQGTKRGPRLSLSSSSSTLSTALSCDS